MLLIYQKNSPKNHPWKPAGGRDCIYKKSAKGSEGRDSSLWQREDTGACQGNEGTA